MLQILLENAFFVVISKPSGVSVHNDDDSVAVWLHKQNKPAHFINRLDRETSGLMIIALKPEFHEPLSEALNNGQKFYRALLCGAWKNLDIPRVEWSWSLTDQAEGFKNVQGNVTERKNCLSIVELQRSNSYFSEVLVELKTGRQHQIRRHAVLHGQAIAGDGRYGNQKHNQKLSQIYKQNPFRLQLHAEQLKFQFEGVNHSFLDKNFSLEHFF